MNEELRRQIENSRKFSDEYNTVTYDLTAGVDFSKPRETAEAFAEIFFDKDGSKWFSHKTGHLEFQPQYRATILITDDHDRKVSRTLSDFMKDLNREVLPEYFMEDIEKVENYTPGLGTYLLLGVGNALISKALVNRSRKRDFLARLMNELNRNIVIRKVSQSN